MAKLEESFRGQGLSVLQRSRRARPQMFTLTGFAIAAALVAVAGGMLIAWLLAGLPLAPSA